MCLQGFKVLEIPFLAVKIGRGSTFMESRKTKM